MINLNIKTYLFVIWFLICGLILQSCRKDNGIEGLKLEDPNSPFSILDSLKPSLSQVDFKSQKISFKASFSKIVNWVIDITPDNPALTTSYSISGKGSVINASNSTWDGSTTILPIFTTGKVNVKLTITNSSVVMTTSFIIKSTKNFTGIIANDFNGGLINPSWKPKYTQNGATMDLFQSYQYQRGNDSIHKITFTSPFNDGFMVMSGIVTWDWLISYVVIPSQSFNYNKTSLINVGSQVYFNAYVYSDTIGGNKNATLQFQMQEDDNGDGKYTAGVDDNYPYVITLNWVGWKKISIRYDSIATVYVPAAGQSKNFGGNNIPQPAHIVGVEIMLLGNKMKQNTICGIDELSFTNSKPFNP